MTSFRVKALTKQLIIYWHTNKHYQLLSIYIEAVIVIHSIVSYHQYHHIFLSSCTKHDHEQYSCFSDNGCNATAI